MKWKVAFVVALLGLLLAPVVFGKGPAVPDVVGQDPAAEAQTVKGSTVDMKIDVLKHK